MTNTPKVSRADALDFYRESLAQNRGAYMEPYIQHAVDALAAPTTEGPVTDTPKPCPFCSETSTAQITTQGEKWGALICTDCGAYGPEVRTNYDKPGTWRADAVEAWNRRVTLTENK